MDACDNRFAKNASRSNATHHLFSTTGKLKLRLVHCHFWISVPTRIFDPSHI